ncbi:hypothetical protein AVEN_109265-1 [Araneus ventricosus]|uniref:RNase H type-1 domain-containing protein n=1 Tax=Araneus ventricosus TaxID=182803 RepID=A0A4Y2V899_ARAVE|nr:hypothetical protein AVEN_109265-1 [Araneus ventricosus]
MPVHGWVQDGELSGLCILCHGKPNYNSQMVLKDAKLIYSVLGRALGPSKSNRIYHQPPTTTHHNTNTSKFPGFKAHVGYAGNEEPDRPAKEAAEVNMEQYQSEVPKSYLKSIFKQKMMQGCAEISSFKTQHQVSRPPHSNPNLKHQSLHKYIALDTKNAPNRSAVFKYSHLQLLSLINV